MKRKGISDMSSTKPWIRQGRPSIMVKGGWEGGLGDLMIRDRNFQSYTRTSLN